MTPSDTPGHGRARDSARNTREMRLATLTLLLPLYVAVGFATNFIGALHAPKPHHVKVAIVGPRPPPRLSRVQSEIHPRTALRSRK